MKTNFIERNTDMTSMFHFYSLGTVSKNKDFDSDIIDVYPIEHLPMTQGDVDGYKDVIDGTIENKNGIVTDIVLEETLTIRAKWLPFGETNRSSAPDLCVGETVLLFRYADSETIHWTTIGNEGTIRQLETVRHLYSNTPDPLVELTENNTYSITISTKEKYVHLHTSDNNGEHTTYDIHIDTGLGEFTIKDGKGNSIILRSHLDDLAIKILRDVNIEVGRDMNISVGRDMNVVVGEKLTSSVGSKTTMTVPVEEHNCGNSFTVNSPNITLNGDVTVTGNIDTAGSTSTAGTVSSATSLAAPGVAMGGNPGTIDASTVNTTTVTATTVNASVVNAGTYN